MCGDRIQKQRITIRVRLSDVGSGDRAASTATIVDDDRLSERVGKLHTNDPRNEISRTTGWNRNDELYGPVWVIALSMTVTGQCENDDGSNNKTLRDSDTYVLHGHMLGRRQIAVNHVSAECMRGLVLKNRHLSSNAHDKC
jgi:hypothetical protein